MTRRVVLVDDDVALRRLVRTTLPLGDYEILEAADGDEALALVEHVVPELVVLDWHMPGRTGDAVLAALKARHPDVPVIVLTAEREPRYRALAESLGADVFLTKPFSPVELIRTVERLAPLA